MSWLTNCRRGAIATSRSLSYLTRFSEHERTPDPFHQAELTHCLSGSDVAVWSRLCFNEEGVFSFRICRRKVTVSPRICLTALLAIQYVVPQLARGQDAVRPSAETRVDFIRDIQPIFAAKCNACHGPDEQEGQLRLDARAAVKQGGVSGVLFEVGKAKESLLYRMIAGIGDVERMPVDDEPLTPRQIELIRRWIDEGADWPDGVGAEVATATHWAYVLPRRPGLPALKNQFDLPGR